MGFKVPRRRIERRTRIESLEDRQMFSGEPLGGSIEQHAPATPDFWYDTSLERDLEALLGAVEKTLASAHALTGVTQAQNDYGFFGYGQTVAVIDSGIAWDHPNLGGGFGANARVVGGWDFTEENDANPYDDGPAGSHGTHVAGTVGASSNGSGDVGVAPGVDLVGLRVFNDQGDGYFSWVEKALRWVHTNRNSFANPITAVNLSLGTAYNAATVPSWAMLEDEFAQLKADGIFIAVSAGNSFSTYNAPGLSYPAASSSVVPVMSVDDSGSLSYFSQRLDRAIAAPGRSIRSTVPDYVGNQNGVTDDWANYSGTSMASPYVAGASVLVREAMQFVGMTNITEDTIYNHMMSTADQFFDSATSQFYKRLNVSAALDALMPDDDFGSSAIDAYDMGVLRDSGQLNGLISKLDDADYFRFTAGFAGEVSFSIDTTHGMTATWHGDGTASGTTLVLDVVAGESYTIGLSSADRLGYYSIDFNVEAMQAPPAILKTLTGSDGAIYSLDAEGILSVNGKAVWNNTFDFAITANDTLYWHSTNGVLQRRPAGGSWQTLDRDTIKFAIDTSGKAYSLGADGWVNVDGMRVWDKTRDFQLTADQTIYWRSNTGLLQRRFSYGSWQTLDRDTIKFEVASSGTAYSLGEDGWVNVNGIRVWNNTADFTIAKDQTLFWLSKSGLLQHRLQNGSWQTLGRNVVKFAVRDDSTAYSLDAKGVLSIDGNAAWGNTHDFLLTADQTLYWQSTTGGLQAKPKGEGWCGVDTGVKEFAVRSDGMVVALTSGGSLCVRGDIVRSNVSGMRVDLSGRLILSSGSGDLCVETGRYSMSRAAIPGWSPQSGPVSQSGGVVNIRINSTALAADAAVIEFGAYAAGAFDLNRQSAMRPALDFWESAGRLTTREDQSSVLGVSETPHPSRETSESSQLAWARVLSDGAQIPSKLTIETTGIADARFDNEITLLDGLDAVDCLFEQMGDD